ncbi:MULTISPECIES: alpha/beta hydrolase [Pseudomonas]|jgi:acetyl esterase|uniref:Acetyl esterase n=2 Tax=Pseudomonas TaxID=286 RepID=A0A370S9Y9_PSEJE|nr:MULTISPECIES: alpha/beta hydrolase [Pseudomonas]MBP5948393.1 alpha/beta hydrolase [Pseudomonas sp. P9(2020)]MBZ9560909.1 alpha/beta hydrolase [Pseudomonas sp. P116]RDL16573.1 acetyl esterase [Pseudomonas jessenii]CEL28598.1 Carboxylesterase NlhH [Pseudomonas fluorescens]VVN69343.1 Carboxylesterase NlhH [Pseudomonas fluorescens]
MSLHPDLEAFLDLAQDSQDAGLPAMHQLTPSEARATFEQTTAQLRWPVPEDLHVTPVDTLARDGAPLALRLYRPNGASAPMPVLVYFHGGGFVVGSLDSHDGVCREFCRRTPCAVLSVGYRLAPEHRFPTALEDGEDALSWLAENAAGLGLDTSRVAFGGDSAGATLATVLAVQAVVQPSTVAIAPKVQLLCYPVTDASRTHDSRLLFGEGYLLENDTLDWFYQHYARSPQDYLDWRFSPLLAEDLRGVAPAIVLLAGFDPLLDEGQAYADKLREHGVSVELEHCSGLTHDLLRMACVMPDVLQVHERLSRVLARALG